jgi:quercetin dioxygenase-like cupin family protein
MKKLIQIALTGIIFLLAATTISCAQDLLKTNPKYTKLLTDTAGVRMIKVTLAPGQEMVMHTHPVQMIYCLQGGQITVNYKDGKKEVFDIKDGDSFQSPADPPHTTKNTGASTITFLEIEIYGKK